MQQRSPAFLALIALGAILLVAGIVYGLGSRQVQYKSVPQGSIAHYLSADGTGYLQMESNSSLYIVHQDNFSPKLPTFADSDTVSFTYDPAETTAIDVKSTLGTHLAGNAAKVVAITSSDTTGQKTYTTPEYTSDPQGYDHNQWPLGLGLLALGLLCIGGSFFLPKKKVQTAVAPSFASTPMPMQPPFPQTQVGTMPYGQQSQPTFPTQYPTTPNFQPQQPAGGFKPPFPAYPQQQPNPFGPPQQPANPFGQQPQQQPNPFGQPQQQPNPFGQPQQQPNPFGQPQQQPNSAEQVQQPPRPSQGQFLRPNPFQPPQQ